MRLVFYMIVFDKASEIFLNFLFAFDNVNIISWSHGCKTKKTKGATNGIHRGNTKPNESGSNTGK